MTSQANGALPAAEIARYGRHLTLPEVGMRGQQALRAGSAVVVGAGGLGSPVAMYLAAAGIGRIGLVEFDRVELSNLQRQVLFGTRDVGRPKIEQARERLLDLNPHVEVECHAMRLAAGNALEILRDYDVVLDGTDNFPTRYLVNDACVMLGKPNVFGSIFRFEGQVSVFHAASGPCYRCLYPEPPAPGSVPNCAEGGVLGVLPGIIGTIQAAEALKLVLGRGESLLGRLLLVDALEMRFRELKLRKDPDCPVCGEQPTLHELSDAAESCATAGDAVPGGTLRREVDVVSLKGEIDGHAAPLLVDVRTPYEWQICRIDGARLIPLDELGARFEELDREADIVVYCHIGSRSAMAVNFLLQQGFGRVRNLVGGINAWSTHVDTSLPRY